MSSQNGKNMEVPADVAGPSSGASEEKKSKKKRRHRKRTLLHFISNLPNTINALLFCSLCLKSIVT